MLSLEKEAGSATIVLPMMGLNVVVGGSTGAAPKEDWWLLLIGLVDQPWKGEFPPALAPSALSFGEAGPLLSFELVKPLTAVTLPALVLRPMEPNLNICFHFLSFEPDPLDC